MASKSTPQQDSVDHMLASWEELPSIDLGVEAAIHRIQRINKHIRKRMDETLGDYGLSYAEWGVLGHLSLAGAPYRSSPGELAEKDHLSSGAMTNRLDRLEKAGLVRRLPDPSGRRALQVELTDKGHGLWVEAVDAQAAKEAALAAALDERELGQLNKLLRKVLSGFEEPG